MRPLVDVSLIGPTRTVPLLGLIDTGSDDTVFPEAIARQVGLDLSLAPAGEMAGIGSRPYAMRYAHVRLRLSDGAEFRDWPAWVGFTAAPLRHPLLGLSGCLQYFTATFHGDREEVELTVNSLYPGT